MPLEPGSDRAVIERNIHEMVAAGHKPAQAVAASLRNANYKRKGYALGGVPSMDPTSGGGGQSLGLGPMQNTLNSIMAPTSSAFDQSWSSRGAMPPTPAPSPPSGTAAVTPPTANPTTPAPMQMASTQGTPPPVTPLTNSAPAPASQAIPMISRDSGGSVPWFARNEARSMTHTGPIHSVVPGRTDHIPLKVPGGSYVLPADAISHLGQNNTNAGQAKANLMFGHTGPFGSTISKVASGRGAPHAPPAPRPPSFPSINKMHVPFQASGGKTHEGAVGGDDDVDIMAAGGEFVVHPEIVKMIGHGNIDHGHRILDNYVMKLREEHKKTLAKLPPPAK